MNVRVRQETISISGFGGGYEDMCQRMLWRGVAYLAERQPPVEMWAGAHAYENIYGVMSTEGEELKALEAAIIKDGDDVTGAMHQAVMSHLAYIHKHGVLEWLREAMNHREPESFFTWEGEL